MSEDGADMGVKPERALKTILGGKKQPTEDEKLSKEKMREEIFRQPDDYINHQRTYDGCSLWLAKQFLRILESGFNGTLEELFEEMKRRNPKQDYDFTGFMVGWANNAARFVLGKPEQQNPAILEMK